MFGKVLAAFVFLGFFCTLSFGADEFALMKGERVGGLRIGASTKEASKQINCKPGRGPDKLWGADGLYHQRWEYAGCGIVLDMVSEKKGGPKTVGSITAAAPCALSTARGIRIGSTEQEVMDAYKASWSKEDSKQGETFVAGSIYGGLVFSLKNGKVSTMFLGAAAE